MRKLLIALGFVLSLGSSYAQEADLDPKFASYMIETERRTIFMQNMNLTEEEAKIFWPIFDQFEAELKVLRESGIENLQKYATQYDSLTDETAAEITKLSLKNEAKRTAIRNKYYKKIEKALGAKVATRFIQLDSIVSMVLRLSIYDELPLVGDE